MDYPHLVTVRLWESIEPLDRGRRYEDPLHDALEAAGVGTVTGGGSQLNALGGVDFAELEVQLSDLEGALEVTIATLEHAGAPRGSELLFVDAPARSFGKLQCLAIYLDGVSLPAEVYAAFDFDDFIRQMELVLNLGGSSFRGVWAGRLETGVYFFGPNADEMFARTEPALRRLPIGQNARVVIRHGNPALEPRTVRLPRL